MIFLLAILINSAFFILSTSLPCGIFPLSFELFKTSTVSSILSPAPLTFCLDASATGCCFRFFLSNNSNYLFLFSQFSSFVELLEVRLKSHFVTLLCKFLRTECQVKCRSLVLLSMMDNESECVHLVTI